MSGAFPASPPTATGGWANRPYAQATRFVLIACLTLAGAWISLAFSRHWGRVTPIWLPNAFVLAFLLQSARRRWPLLLTAGLAGNVAACLLSGDGLAIAVGTSLANSAEVLICALVARQLIGGRIQVGRLDHLGRFGLIAVASAMISAVLGALCMHWFRGAPFQSNAILWALTDSLGLLILTPPLLVVGEGGLRDLLRPQWAPRSLLVLSAYVAAIATAAVLPQHPLLLLTPPILILAAVQLEFAGAALCMLAVTATTMTFVMLGWIPLGLVGRSATFQMLMLQAYMFISATTAFPVAAVLASRREIEAKLLESRDFAQEAIRQARLAEGLAGIGYWRVQHGDTLFTWSDQMYQIYGRDRALGPPDMSMTLQSVHPDDQARLTAHRIEHALSDSTELETRIVRPDGEVRHIIARSMVEKNAVGEITARFGTCVDVTEIKHAQAAAEESERRYRFLAENAPDMISRTGVAGGMLYISPSSVHVFGYTPEEMGALNAQEMVHPDDFERVMAGIFRLVEERLERLPEPICYRAKHKNGDWVWIEANPTLIFDDKGEPLEFIDVVRNVTQTKLFEAELEEARRRAEAAAAAKSVFLANMSHELRTPLTSIIGFSRLMGDRRELTSETRHFAKRISDASEALLSIINDVLDFSKLEAGQVALETQPLSVRRLVEETTGLITIQAAAKGLEMRTELDPNLPEQVDGDVARLRQVLLNFLSNGVKFTDRGSVTINIGYDAETSRMRLGVTDTGPGISEEGKARLFERFSQAEVSINRTHGGTGLGLAISRGIIELMGGEIGVDSEPGQGATFWFDVPAPAAVETAVDIDDHPDIDCPPLHILMVDDTAVNRELVKLMLSPLGFQITEAGGGAEGVQIALAERFDLILMDVRMPGVDGLEATRVIRGAGGANSMTPILALTADVQPENAAACLAAGMNDVLAKPISPTELLTKVVHWGAPTDEAAEGGAPATGTDG